MRSNRTTRRILFDPETGASEPFAGIKKATGAAQKAAGTAAQTGGGFGESAADINATLVPTLKRDVTNAPGLTPQERSAELVAGEEGAGGALSSIAGEAGLRAARSRNLGATSGVLDEAAREKMRTSAATGLNVEQQNTMLKQQQRAQALKQLEGLYGTDVGAELKAQGLVPEDINAWANANKTGWVQNVDETLKALQGAGMKGVTV